jgi:hypothetical protein
MPTTENGSGKDAFSMLMTKKVNDSNGSATLRRTSSIGTEFIVCPAGCGKRMLEKEINQHLDRCIGLQPNETDDSCQGSASQSQREASSPDFSTPSSQLLTQPTSGLMYGINTLGGMKMSSKKRRRVTCPSCQNSFPSALINLHLDQCIHRSRSSLPKTNVVTSPKSTPKPFDASFDNNNTKVALSNDAVSAASTSLTVNEVTVNTEEDGVTLLIGTQLNHSASEANCSNLGLISSDASETIPTHLNVETLSRNECSVSPSRNKAPLSDPNSAFATMMKQSKAMFGKKDKSKPPLHLSFHLDESLRVRLRYPMTVETEWTPPIWSVLMNVRDKFSKIPDLENPNQASPIPMEVTVSSDIPSYINQPIRWVRQHSQLSVPVLKSILQKSIRRRKPLPAVRIAMELADKGLGELLRRIPIIMIEDSYLHPDISFLIWIMMAYTKDYQPPSKVMIRIFQIIYEIAACQWSDPIPHTTIKSTTVTETTVPSVSLTSLFHRDHNEMSPSPISTTESSSSVSSSSSSCFDDGTTFVWSLLVRAEYGGMKCDIDMLHQYAQVWMHRCSNINPPSIPYTIIQQFVSTHTTSNGIHNENRTIDTTTHRLQWCHIPTLLHQKSREQSCDRVLALCNPGVDRLLYEDICIEGIDYHCSSIITALMSDEYICDICLDLMTLAEASLSSMEGTTATTDSTDQLLLLSTPNENRRTRLEHLFKVVLWDFSSSVNHRRPLLVNDTLSNGTHPPTSVLDPHRPYFQLWNDLIAPRVKEYQKVYVQQRLVRS